MSIDFAVLGLAAVSGAWFGWLAYRTIPTFTLAVVVLAVPLTVGMAAGAADGWDGAVWGLRAGGLLTIVPIMGALTWQLAAVTGRFKRFQPLPQRAVPWGFATLTAEAAAWIVWTGTPATPLLWGGMALLGIAALDDFVYDRWGQWVISHWLTATTTRIAVFGGAMNAAMGVLIPYVLRSGLPVDRAADTYVARSVPLTSADPAVLLTLVPCLVALLAVLRGLTRDQRLLVAVGCLAPLCGWLLVARLLPDSLADLATWGVLYSMICFLAAVIGLWIEGPPESSSPAQAGTAGDDTTSGARA